MEVLTGIATAKVVGACAAGTIVDGLAHLERHKGSSERQVGQEKQLEQEHGVLSSQTPQQLSERLLLLLVSGMVGAEETGVTFFKVPIARSAVLIWVCNHHLILDIRIHNRN